MSWKRVARVAAWAAPALPVLLFLSIALYVHCCNRTFMCRPLLLDLRLPSEAGIPADAFKGDPASILNTFRYGPTGTELGGGVPYWIFRALPRLFADEFAGQPADNPWQKFGLLPVADDGVARTSGVPRGMFVADGEVQLPGARLGLRLKRVAINCSGCHQGEYLDDADQRVIVDGAPNQVANLRDYKYFVRWAFAQPRFNPTDVLAAIEAELATLQRPPLTAWERRLYTILVVYLRDSTRAKKPNAWMEARPLNGPGRIDAFGSFQFEVLGIPGSGLSTVDLPSIWNQGPALRERHHWDGNTADSKARNYGSVVGVGGASMSVRFDNVNHVGAWLDSGLSPPKFPFRRGPEGEPPAVREARIARGRDVYVKACFDCHGLYDPATRTVARGKRYMTSIDVGTDADRWKAFPAATAAALNAWGHERGVWSETAFQARSGYLAGPLDGIWARAPYLHNGSVPTLRALVTKGARPVSFYRGSRRYDPRDMGWEWDRAVERGTERALYAYIAKERGNLSGGHEFWIEDPVDVDALLDYLTTL